MRWFSIVLVACTVHVARAERYEDPSVGGFFVAAGGGLNVSHPFGELQVGRRFQNAPHFELYLDYSYDGTISEFPFQTFGIGGRTYLAHVAHCELFYQGLASFALAQGGDLRAIGDRLLGGFFTQGLGLQVVTGSAWTIEASIATGYPVWLRSDIALKVRF